MKIDNIILKYSLGAMLNSYRGIYDTKKSKIDFEDIEFVIIKQSQYMICRKENFIIISFQGSVEISDWINDFMAAKSEIPYDGVNPKIKVHSGFLAQYKILRKRILADVDNYIKQTNGISKLIFTGHSLGGAIAILAALDFQYHNIMIPQCVVFGCPRVGNLYFADSYNKRIPSTWRIECGDDVITKVPSFLIGFKHVGEKVHYPSLRSILNPTKYLLDHLPNNYARTIERFEGIVI